MRDKIQLRRFSRSFRAMGTDVQLWLWSDHEQRANQALAAGERFFAQTEARLTRFDPNSELSRLNRAAGQPFGASSLLYGLAADALAWRERTGGIFDPAVLHSLIAHGYDRTFSAVAARQAEAAEAAGADDQPPSAPPDLPRPKSSGVDSSGVQFLPGRRILLPAGVGLDLGGIAKGWTIQQVAHRLGMWGPCLVDAGGDIACTGITPDGPWVVTVADPLDEESDAAVMGLSNGAVATSSRVKRRWQHAGKPAHHLIDPRTGAPAETDLLSVTVTGVKLPDVEIHAKCALILGAQRGLAYLEQQVGIAALLIGEDGRQWTSGGLEEKAYVSSHSFVERFRNQAPIQPGGNAGSQAGNRAERQAGSRIAQQGEPVVGSR